MAVSTHLPLLAAAFMAAAGGGAWAAETKKLPATQYWVSVITFNHTIPGMETSGGGLSKLLGAALDVPGMGPQRSLVLQLATPKGSGAPEAQHAPPAGQKMGPALPLLAPPRLDGSVRDKPDEREFEKPKAKLVVYWGCSDQVRPGQPRVIDTQKMNPAEFTRLMASRVAATPQPPAPGSAWTVASWPNEKDSQAIPKDASLRGDHAVQGANVPDIHFTLGPNHDFMEPVVFTAPKGELPGTLDLGWKTVPTAIGYFAFAIAHDEKSGETILWNSSESYDAGWGLMDFLPSGEVRRLIKEKVLLAPSATRCAMPAGIFKKDPAPVLQLIAYGDDFGASAEKGREPAWTARVRLKSVGMMPLGAEAAESGKSEEKARGPGEGPLKALKRLFQ